MQGLAVFLGRDHSQDLAPGVQPGCAGAVQGVQRLHLAQPAGCQGQSINRLGAAAVGGRAADQASQRVVIPARNRVLAALDALAGFDAEGLRLVVVAELQRGLLQVVAGAHQPQQAPEKLYLSI